MAPVIGLPCVDVVDRAWVDERPVKEISFEDDLVAVLPPQRS